MARQYIDNLKNLIGNSISVEQFSYRVNAFSDMNNKVDVVYLQSETSVLFVRPSGTGPNIRIYVFGPQNTYEQELSAVVDFVKSNSS